MRSQDGSNVDGGKAGGPKIPCAGGSCHSLPATSESVSAVTKAAIEEAVNALSWLHQVAGLPPVSGLLLVQAALAGHRRILAQPKSAKGAMLKAMVDAAGPEPSLSEVRFACHVSLGFCWVLEVCGVADVQ